MWFFRAVAFDLDGTLTSGERIATEVLTAIDDTRRDHAVLLVTGRVKADLERVFPGLIEHFSAVVTENGAVLTTRTPDGWETRLLREPVDVAIDKMLADRSISTSRGDVLTAVDGRDAGVAADVISDLGLDSQVIHNRGRAMILPAGVTKGSGLRAGLQALGLGEHSAIAVGDAENDLSLLHAAEVGVAVADAVPSLKDHADLVLDLPDGKGVVDLLAGPLLTGRQRLCPSRRWITIGHHEDGSAATVPGSQASILVTGSSGSGKSYLAGLLCERWIDAGYALLVIDPEGDHLGLARRPGVHLVDASAGLPSPHDLMALLRFRQVSVVLDLSGIDLDAQLGYLDRLPAAIAAERAQYGVPHWVIYDEAHQQARLEQSHKVAVGTGSCLVTWRPELLSPELTDDIDVTISIAEPAGSAPATQTYATLTLGGASRSFQVGRRTSEHVRHQRKYAQSPLPPERRFYFHDQDRAKEAVSAATLEEFRHQVGHVDSSTLDFHLSRGDFSRWVAGIVADHALAGELARIEDNWGTRRAAAIERAREQICRAVERRYFQP